MTTETEREIGRPSIFGQDLADTFCEMIAEGQNLTWVCQQEGMPHKATVYRWLAQHEGFRRQYAIACEVRTDAWAEDLYEVAETATPEDTARARLMVDTRKWLMAKMAPRKYGDKITNEIGGINGASIPVTVTTDLDRAKALAAMIAKTQVNAPAAK